jgi:NitT/TauT family transport system substrate-binding protein
MDSSLIAFNPKPSSRWKRAVLLACCLGLILASCSHGTTPAFRSVKVSVQPYLSFGPLFIAADEGFFAAQGLQVEFVKMENSTEAIPALDMGRLDVVGGAVSLGVLNAIARGAQVRVVADKGQDDPNWGSSNAFLIRRDLASQIPRTQTARLRGLRVVLNPVSYSGFVLEKALLPAGLSLADLKISKIPDSVLPEAFKQGTVDLAEANEPWLSLILQQGTAVIWLEPKSIVPGMQKAVLFYGPNFLKKDPMTGIRFMQAYLQGVRRFRQGKTPRNLEILCRNTHLDHAVLERATWSAINANGDINGESLQELMAWGIRKGHLSSSLPFERIWDGRFVKAACAALDRKEP